MPLFATIFLLVVLGLCVVTVVLADRKLPASNFKCLSLALGLQGVLLLVYYFLDDRPPLAMSWHAALFVSLVFPLPMMGYTWALDFGTATVASWESTVQRDDDVSKWSKDHPQTPPA